MLNGFVGYGNKARKIKSVYVGVNNIARLCNRAYVGVNGVAQEVIVDRVPIPTVKGAYTYNGQTQEVEFNNLVSSEVSVSGTTTEVNAGVSHVITFSLRSEYSIWSDGTTGDKTLTWEINPAIVSVPTVSSTTKTYNGSEQSVNISSYDTNLISISGTVNATNAGSYSLSFNLRDTQNYVWDDSTTTTKTVTWVINRLVIAKPTYSGSFTYSGSAQSPTVNDFTYSDSTADMFTVSATGQINAGTYQYTMSIKPISGSVYNYQFDDNTTSFVGNWSISKVNVTIEITQFTDSISKDRAHTGKYVVKYPGEHSGRAEHCNVVLVPDAEYGLGWSLDNNSDNTFSYLNYSMEGTYDPGYTTYADITISIIDTANKTATPVTRTVYSTT